MISDRQWKEMMINVEQDVFVQIRDKIRNKLCGIYRILFRWSCVLLKMHGEQQEVLDNRSELKFVVCRLLFRVCFSSARSCAFISFHFVFFSSRLLRGVDVCVCVCARLCVFCMLRFYSLFLSYLFELTCNHHNGITRQTCYHNRIHTFPHM